MLLCFSFYEKIYLCRLEWKKELLHHIIAHPQSCCSLFGLCEEKDKEKWEPSSRITSSQNWTLDNYLWVLTLVVILWIGKIVLWSGGNWAGFLLVSKGGYNFSKIQMSGRWPNSGNTDNLMPRINCVLGLVHVIKVPIESIQLTIFIKSIKWNCNVLSPSVNRIDSSKAPLSIGSLLFLCWFVDSFFP